MKSRFFHKIVAALFFVCLFCCLSASEDFLLLRRNYYMLRGCYKLALNGDITSDRKQEMEQLAKDFAKSCRDVQKVLDQMGFAPDIQFPVFADELLARSQAYAKNNLNVSKAADSDDVNQGKRLAITKILELLEDDIMVLKEYNFSTENGGTVEPQVAMWPDFYEFKRFLKFYQREKNLRNDLDKNAKWRAFFDSKMKRAIVLAGKLNRLTQKRFPNWEGHIDVLRETKALNSFISYKFAATGKMDSLAVKANHLGGGKAEADKEEMETRNQKLALERLSRFMSKLERRLLEITEEELKEQKQQAQEEQRQAKEQEKKEQEKDSEKAVPVADKKPSPVRKPTPKIPVERWKENELDQGLEELHNSVFPSLEAESVSKEELTRCMETLSPKQRDQYEKIRRRLIRTGTKENDAPLAALKELKPILSGYNIAPTRQEKIDILKKAGK